MGGAVAHALPPPGVELSHAPCGGEGARPCGVGVAAGHSGHLDAAHRHGSRLLVPPIQGRCCQRSRRLGLQSRRRGDPAGHAAAHRCRRLDTGPGEAVARTRDASCGQGRRAAAGRDPQPAALRGWPRARRHPGLHVVAQRPGRGRRGGPHTGHRPGAPPSLEAGSSGVVSGRRPADLAAVLPSARAWPRSAFDFRHAPRPRGIAGRCDDTGP